MTAIKNFCSSFGAYLETPKGAHDFKDYLRAAGAIGLTTLIAVCIVGRLF